MTTEIIHAACVALAQSMLSPEQFGHAVTAEVRDAARKALGCAPVEQAKYLNATAVTDRPIDHSAGHKKLLEFISDFEIDSGEGCYIPNGNERFCIEEFILELMNNDDAAEFIKVEYTTLLSAAPADHVRGATEMVAEAKPVAADLATVAWLIEDYGRNDKLRKRVVLSPLTDHLDESAEAMPLCKIEDAKAMLDAAPQQPTPAARDVLAERDRQQSIEGWTPAHDDKHADGELAAAAAFYAANASAPDHAVQIYGWPWHPDWFKKTTPRRDLVKAGALILAEIERIDRAALQAGEQS